MPDDATRTWQDEKEYQDYLNEERRLYALALVNYGGYPEAIAKQEALERYPYQPPNAPFRGSIFHDLAWHWAMLRIYGEGYWISQPELRSEPEAFGE